MSFWTEPQLVGTWKCFLKVHCQPRSHLSLFCVCASLHLLYCEAGPENAEPASSENSRSKVPIKANPLPSPSMSRLNSSWIVFIALVFTQRMKIPDPDVFSAILIQYFFILVLHNVMSWASVYLSVHFYVWMIVLSLFIWIVFYTLPQHLSG